MGDAVIGALRVVLALDAGEFSRGADEARAQASSFEQAMANTAKRIAAAFASLKIAEAISSSLEAISQLNKLSQQTGISTESLSKLKFAAEETGVGFDAFSSIVEHFNRQLVEISKDPTTTANQALTALGVNLRDVSTGALKNFDVLLPEVANKFATYADGANKSALATAIFGKAGAELIPLLNQGAAGLARLGEEARASGNVLDVGVAQRMKEATDASHKLQAAWDGLIQQLTIALGPALKTIANILSYIVSGFSSLNQLSTEELNKQIDETTKKLGELYAERKRFETSTTGIGWVDAAQLGLLQTEIDRTEAKLADFKKALADRKPIEVDIKVPAPDLSALAKVKQDLDEMIERLHGLPILFGQAFAFDARPFDDAMKKVNEALQKNVITAQQAAKIKLQLQKMEQEEILNTASLAASTITAVFGKSKLAAIAAAIINTAVAVTKALSGSVPPFNFINAALVAAAGAAQIATIKSTSETGGGSVSAPATPAASADTGAAAAPAQGQTIFIEGFNPNQWYSGSAMRDFIAALNGAIADGAKLVLK